MYLGRQSLDQISPIGARIFLQSDFSVTADGGYHDINWGSGADTDIGAWDFGDWYNFGSQPTRLTVPDSADGKLILISSGTIWTTSTSGYRQIAIRHFNSSDTILDIISFTDTPIPTFGNSEKSFSAPFRPASGDYFTLSAATTTGSLSIDAVLGNQRTFFAANVIEI